MTSKHLEYASELQDKLDKDLSWRRKEIIDLALLVDTKNGEIKITLIRSAIALLYAHWEGFIKNASIHYLEYICKLKLRLAFLTENFCHISLGKKFSKTTSVHSYESQKALFDYIFYDHENTEFMVVPKSTLTVDGNLKFEVFKVITKQIGVDVSHYETKEKLINSILLRLRNDIVHGEYRRSEELLDDYLLLKDNVLELLDGFKTLIIDSFEQKKYLR